MKLLKYLIFFIYITNFNNVSLSKNPSDLINEIVTFGPKMAHDDTIETLYYAQLHAFPPNMKKNKEQKIWYKPKKKAKSWVVA